MKQKDLTYYILSIVFGALALTAIALLFNILNAPATLFAVIALISTAIFMFISGYAIGKEQNNATKE